MRTDAATVDEVLNLTEAAGFIRVSGKTLREMARRRRVPCQKVGREWRFLRRSLEEWLAGEQRNTIVSEPIGVYGQETLFPETAVDANEEVRPGFGDTAFTKNRREPLHRWVPWVAGFSAAFVEEALERTVHSDPSKVLVLDPFAGVGTTLVEGLKRGYNVVGFEINPYAALVCQAKTSCVACRLDQLTEAIRRIEEIRERRRGDDLEPTSCPPADFRSRVPFFSPAVQREVLLVQDVIEKHTTGHVRKMLEVALGAVMVSFSNYSYEPSLSTRSAAGKGNIDYADVLKIVCNKLWEIEADVGFMQRHMKRFKHKPSAKVHRSSYLGNAIGLNPRSVDVLVTSPPYLNNYHYVRNTRPQLYWLRLVKSTEDLKRLETESFGQFWQTVRGGPPIGLSFELPELENLLQSIRRRNPHKGIYGGAGWANYAAAYFNDCNRFFTVTRRVMRPGGLVIIVIGNNIVQGIHIATDRLLAEIGRLHGFSVEGMHEVRKKRTGSSIVNSSVRAGTMEQPTELYETAVELRAPGRRESKG